MKKSPLVIYCYIYFLLSLVDVLYAFTDIDFSISVLIRLAVTVTLFIVFWGYLYSKPVLDAETWRRVFYVLVVVYGFLGAMALLSFGTPKFYEGLISVITTIPILYCLYIYSDTKQKFWENKV
ncbi:hypothetical protein [Colwellia sp. MB02u-9]|jgi:accessory gene regulator protein AgrB|uniref:hypothetical protein n=1 Tax=Colwellia sp. MB02u-9 TaxID=2759823 RepID=UPI0015F5E7C0|nr:hypothetical protein [Colwellia sp. MB02u-9]MBA6294855.1 hypothetical protein [Colwellia sp. MB02u-9]